MTDHEQQAIESATLEIHSVAAISVDVAERVAEAALSSLKASGVFSNAGTSVVGPSILRASSRSRRRYRPRCSSASA